MNDNSNSHDNSLDTVRLELQVQNLEAQLRTAESFHSCAILERDLERMKLDSARRALDEITRVLAQREEELHELDERHTKLTAAAKAVVARWNTPAWKHAPATGTFINALRDALKGDA